MNELFGLFQRNVIFNAQLKDHTYSSKIFFQTTTLKGIFQRREVPLLKMFWPFVNNLFIKIANKK